MWCSRIAKRNISAGEMYLNIPVDWTAIKVPEYNSERPVSLVRNSPVT